MDFESWASPITPVGPVIGKRTGPSIKPYSILLVLSLPLLPKLAPSNRLPLSLTRRRYVAGNRSSSTTSNFLFSSILFSESDQSPSPKFFMCFYVQRQLGFVEFTCSITDY